MDYEQDYLSNKEIDMEYKFKPFDLEAGNADADELEILEKLRNYANEFHKQDVERL